MDERVEPIAVAVVDDDPDIRALLKLNLEVDDRFELVGEAADGVQAIELIEAVRPDVVILDLDMPKLNGVEAIRTIRNLDFDTKVVVYSARYDKFDAGDLLIERAHLYVDKTRSVGQLLNEIQELLEDAA